MQAIQSNVQNIAESQEQIAYLYNGVKYSRYRVSPTSIFQRVLLYKNGVVLKWIDYSYGPILHSVFSKKNVRPVFFDFIPFEVVAFIANKLSLKSLLCFTATNKKFSEGTLFFLKNNVYAQTELIRAYQCSSRFSIPQKYLNLCTKISHVQFYDAYRTEEQISSLCRQFSKLKFFSLYCKKTLDLSFLNNIENSRNTLEQLTLQFEQLSLSPKDEVFFPLQKVRKLRIFANFFMENPVYFFLLCATPSIQCIELHGKSESKTKVDLGVLVRSFEQINSIRCSSIFLEIVPHQDNHNAFAQITRLEFSRCQTMDDRMIKKIAKTCLNLTDFTISECANVYGETLYKLGERCSYLEAFVCKAMCSLTEFGIEQFSKKFKKMKKLKITRTSALCDDYVINLLAFNQDLQSLSLSHCPNLTSQLMKYIFMYAQLLQELSISGFSDVKDVDVKNLYLYNNNNNKNNIRIDSNPLLSETSYIYISTIGQNLKKLTIGGNKRIRPEVLSALFKKCINIEYLQLREINFELRDYFVKWAKKLNHLKQLKVIRIKWITDRGLKKLSTHCPSLKKISFTFCSGITIQGIKYLMQNCRKIKKIHIEWCSKITRNENEFIKSYYGMINQQGSFFVSRLNF